ncbi:MAG: SOS response-associated peptidase [Rhodococcus sp.]|mgnify:CR=1 FL=1|uniref:SOS response-associated peptidase n=1 Tax=Rhodococcus sp. TaxID=1831 RepID=UPI0016AA1C47|nr:SOS response-associated peptidase [Rhodococcus sp. (in: high G+C Gram-positive bacteria)]NLV80706.1 SOS response-associated peptidase [Rhodococcus sp. (in: high G+C Gram-positive bacteria)]
MCGRYAITVDPASSAADLDAIDETDDEFTPDYNVAPTTRVLTVVARHDRDDPEGAVTRRIRRMRWGLVPSFADEIGRSAPLFNARSESVATKPSFAQSLRYRRCLVPMDGWYEWQVEPAPDGKARKVPYFMSRDDGEPICMAGLWSVWHDPRVVDSPPLLSATVLTAESVAQLSNLHHRMPLILPRDRWDAWLDPDSLGHPDLIVPSAEEVSRIGMRRVSDKVNSVRNNGPDLTAPFDGGGDQLVLL